MCWACWVWRGRGQRPLHTREAQRSASRGCIGCAEQQQIISLVGACLAVDVTIPVQRSGQQRA
jgi:hypothetical protein